MRTVADLVHRVVSRDLLVHRDDSAVLVATKQLRLLGCRFQVHLIYVTCGACLCKTVVLARLVFPSIEFVHPFHAHALTLANKLLRR